MTSIIDGWEKLKKDAAELEKLADKYNKKIAFLDKLKIESAYAYDEQEIYDVIDIAGPGREIELLANYLGTDAATAFEILKQTQEQTNWDAASRDETFRKLENTAIVIKDTCKVAGYVGGIIITGGASGIAGATVLAKTALVVGGADMVLEVSSGVAYISLGDNNQVTEVLNNIRTVTEPVATILTITALPQNLAGKFDKFNGAMFGVDQFRALIQDGKVIGIELPSNDSDGINDYLGAVVMTPGEVEGWLKENGREGGSDTAEDLLGISNNKDAEEARKAQEAQRASEAQQAKVKEECIPNWQCSEWSTECKLLRAGSYDGEYTRVCKDVNNCNNNYDKPPETYKCYTFGEGESTGDATPWIYGNIDTQAEAKKLYKNN